MNDGYRIQEVSQRSGFSAATLRYYEGIGLVPPVGRTPAGYRVYDDTTLARLAFVARAKQLGCTLDEISELNTAWRTLSVVGRVVSPAGATSLRPPSSPEITRMPTSFALRPD